MSESVNDLQRVEDRDRAKDDGYWAELERRRDEATADRPPVADQEE
jgi:hypothetical protein